MCDFNGSFKLCTCEDHIDKSKPWWELKRRKIKKPGIDEMVVGSIPMPFYFMFGDADLIKFQLNARNVFDFDYKPKTNDELEIHIPGEGTLVLYYRGGHWVYEHEPLGWEVLDENLIHKGIIEKENTRK